MNFKFLSTSAAFICLVLAFSYVFVPQLFFWMWNVEYSYPVGLAAKRSGALFFGVGVMLWLARNAPVSEARTALSRGFALGCFGLAVLGLYELISGHAGYGILLAASVELVLGVGFFSVDARDA